MKIAYEVQSNVEIWRTSYCTFTVMYPTESLVCVKGLRGTFSIYDYKALNNLFYERGFKKVIFERMVDGELVEQERTLRPPFPDIDATTYFREPGKR
ncbi:hypothetical protein [Marisediminitalea sp.]|uniref:hypothetical protein n=1 Tax=Marisediminitalea sp. TaxID=2662268 RepID=UPI003515D0BC